MQWQIDLLSGIQSFRSPFLDYLFELITMTAEETFFIVVAAWFLWCYNKKAGYRVGFAFLTSTVFNPFLKNIFRFDRPIGVEGIESLRTHTAGGFSFPSGHTQGAASFWFAILLFFKKRWVSFLSVLMIILVGFSRMYLGVHWFTDILGGIFFAIVWVLLITALFDYVDASGKYIYLWLSLLPFTIAYLVWDDKALTVSLGSSIGFLGGYMFEKLKLNFSEKNIWYKQILKLVLGIAVALLIQMGAKYILPFHYRLADLLRYAMLGFWITGGAPYIFQKIKLG